MDILTAFLTAILYWLFLCHCASEARARACQRAGPLLRKWTAVNLGVRRAFVLVMNAGMVPVLAFTLNSCSIGNNFSWLRFLALSWLILTLILWRLRRLLLPVVEFRERGILRFGLAVPAFMPWASIQYCQTPTTGELQVQTRTGRHKLECVPSSNMDEAAAILARYVEVRDVSGGVRVPETKAVDKSAGPDPDRVEHGRFQFSLRTLLFFVLVASSAMSWYGIRYRRNATEREVLGQLEKFQPKTSRFGGDLEVDFSASPVKPGDREMEIIAKLSRLQHLNLTGAPVTDSGLVHLEKLTSLRWVFLYHTRVTDAGVKRLQRAVPKADISH